MYSIQLHGAAHNHARMPLEATPTKSTPRLTNNTLLPPCTRIRVARMPPVCPHNRHPKRPGYVAAVSHCVRCIHIYIVDVHFYMVRYDAHIMNMWNPNVTIYIYIQYAHIHTPLTPGLLVRSLHSLYPERERERDSYQYVVCSVLNTYHLLYACNIHIGLQTRPGTMHAIHTHIYVDILLISFSLMLCMTTHSFWTPSDRMEFLSTIPLHYVSFILVWNAKKKHTSRQVF